MQSSFRLRLLERMPAYSQRTHLFRSNLALAFFLDDISSIREQSDGPCDMRRLTRKLQRMQLVAAKGDDIDYVELAATVSILDMALDVCIPPPPSPSPRATTESTTESTAVANNANKNKNSSDKAEEDAFNRRVDDLAHEVKAIFSRIPDAGAGHITRTEAKEVLNRVHYRIAYAVRTRPRPKKNLFESSLAPSSSSSKGENLPPLPLLEGPMAKFLNRKKER